MLLLSIHVKAISVEVFIVVDASKLTISSLKMICKGVFVNVYWSFSKLLGCFHQTGKICQTEDEQDLHSGKSLTCQMFHGNNVHIWNSGCIYKTKMVDVFPKTKFDHKVTDARIVWHKLSPRFNAAPKFPIFCVTPMIVGPSWSEVA